MVGVNIVLWVPVCDWTQISGGNWLRKLFWCTRIRRVRAHSFYLFGQGRTSNEIWTEWWKTRTQQTVLERFRYDEQPVRNDKNGKTAANRPSTKKRVTIQTPAVTFRLDFADCFVSDVVDDVTVENHEKPLIIRDININLKTRVSGVRFRSRSYSRKFLRPYAHGYVINYNRNRFVWVGWWIRSRNIILALNI